MSNSTPPVVCIVGATGLVGGVLLKLIEERKFPVKELRALSSKRSAGRTIEFRGSEIPVTEATPDSFNGANLVFFAATAKLSRALAPEAVKRGAIVIDKSGSWRLDESVPLIIPEINGDELSKDQGIIACPNCSTVGFAMTLAALEVCTPIEDVVVTTFQSASGAGAAGVEQLAAGGDGRAFPRPLTGDIIPQCESFLDNGFTTEEEKLLFETRKILGQAKLKVTMTCTRVPVDVGHSASMLITPTKDISVEEARQALSNFSGIEVVDEPMREIYPSPADTAGSDKVRVGRIRKEHDGGNRIWLWQVTDNLRKGAALNSLQIAEHLLDKTLL